MLAARSQVPDAIARHRGVGRDHGVDAARGDTVRNRFDSGIVQIGCDLHRQRDAVSVPLREQVALRGQGDEERIEAVSLLQRAQILGVGRRNVRGDEARVCIHLAQAGDVILVRALVRRI